MDKKKVLKVAGLAGLAILGGAVGYVGNELTSEPQIIEVEKNVTVEVPVEVPVEVIKEVPVNVTVEKIVEVEDEAFKRLACDRLFYDEVSECVEEVDAEEAALQLAIEKIKADFADELEDAGIVDDEDEVEIVKVYDDYEDIEVLDSDFDDEEYEFEIKVKVDDEDADEKKTVYFTVKVENGEAEITDVEE